jgi:hypothetical protein
MMFPMAVMPVVMPVAVVMSVVLDLGHRRLCRRDMNTSGKWGSLRTGSRQGG